MKKYYLLLILSSFTFMEIYSSHIVGGELNYKYLGNWNYKIRLTVCTDTTSCTFTLNDELTGYFQFIPSEYNPNLFNFESDIVR